MSRELDPKHLYALSREGRAGLYVADSDVPSQPMPDAQLLRSSAPDLPEMSQQAAVRYFTRLSQKNFSIDTNFYPLGSCTMKYNPKINEQLAGLDGLAGLHPRQTDDYTQGALQIMYELQGYLSEITGFDGFSLAPLAGAQGEYAGLAMIRAYLRDKGETQRTVALVPDSAHGTNPASATMAGLTVKTVGSTADGQVDLEQLRQLADDTTAVFMLTLPNTLGLFERNVLEITKIIHDSGGLVYADGANLNAMLGVARFADLGFDVCHSNLHKTFSTPHGGGGPGAGPVGVVARLKPYLPAPTVELEDGQYRMVTPPKSIGRLSMYHGSFGILVRAYVYIRTFGREWLSQISRDAIINANYIQSQLRDQYQCMSGDSYCMHETILTAVTQKKQHGVTALDISKRLLDYGIHSPTMYFPLIAPEALMVEPTECESRETLDRFIEVMRQIAGEAETEPELVKSAPHTAPRERLNEAEAARSPKLKWSKI